MQDRTGIEALLAEHLVEPTSSWSVGEFGVLAEFHHGSSSESAGGEWIAQTRGGAILR